MEKVILVLREQDGDEQWCEQLRGPVAEELLDLELPGLTVNVKDARVRDSLMTLSTLDPPVKAIASIWTQQSYGPQVTAALARHGEISTDVFGYLVAESTPLPPPVTEPATRTTGLANVALLRRPADLDEATWRQRWQIAHAPVAFFGTDDDDELGRRITRMVASTSAFGANENIDTVPTSRYVWRSAFVPV